MSSLAEETRTAVRARPFLYRALAANVVNYTEAAAFLPVGGDRTEAVATALRRYADDLTYGEESRDVRVTMQSGLVAVEDGGAGLFSVNGQGFAAADGTGDGDSDTRGDYTGVLASGDVDTRALGSVIGRLDVTGVTVAAAGVAGDTLLVVVDRADGATAVREIEAALDAVPSVDD
ncbi:DUF7523 family protein [Halospeciosus flavus]|uniref:Arginine repressor n=1 Tax=Halospeciosus flavus TaxID=3032283 RepID=A0ABD5Z2K5_9EURY|nr:hypothetical protein [Halospeciosus flavus]